jgi:DNA-directed RNA polymerase specialized sigma24 family protein
VSRGEIAYPAGGGESGGGRGSRQGDVDWRAVVQQIRDGDPAGEEVLYRNLAGGARIFFQRRLGKTDLEDHVHDLFLTLVETIRRGELREPERLMGFVRTILYRQLNAEIARTIQSRETAAPLDRGIAAQAREPDPEQLTFEKEKVALMRKLLSRMRRKDFEILNRYYLREEPEDLICADMGLTPLRFRVLKSRAKARFADLVQRKLVRHQISRG